MLPLRSVSLLLIAVARAAAAPLPDDALVDEGTKKLHSGDLDGALAAFMRAEKAAPKDPRPLFYRGAVLAHRHDPAGAAKAYRAAIALDGKFADAHLELGTILLDQNKLDDAAASFKAATDARPDLEQAWFNLGLVEGQRKKYDAAVAAFKRANALKPSVETTGYLATAHRKKGDPAGAEAAIRDAIAKNFPKSLALQVELARTLGAAKKCADADAVLARLPPAHDSVRAATKEVRTTCPAPAKR